MVRTGFVRVWSDIPKEWKDLIETSAMKKEGAHSVSEYIRALIRQDLRKKGLLVDSEILKSPATV